MCGALIVNFDDRGCVLRYNLRIAEEREFLLLFNIIYYKTLNHRFFFNFVMYYERVTLIMLYIYVNYFINYFYPNTLHWVYALNILSRKAGA